MECLDTYEELCKRVARLQEGTLRSARAERKRTWEGLIRDPFIDSLPAGFAIYTEDFVLLDCNRTYRNYIEKYTPFTPEEAMGMCYFDYKPGSIQSCGAWYRHVRDSHRAETCYGFELRSITKRNTIDYALSFWDVYLSPVLDQHDSLAGSLMCCIDITEQIATKKALQEQEEILQAKKHSIQNMKCTIRSLLEMSDQDQVEHEKQLLATFGQALRPWLEKLKTTRLNSEQKSIVDIIELNMVDMASAFKGIISTKVPNLTPTELQVAQLVKLGKSSKEIASLMVVSKECIDFHRNNLRKKLGLSNQKVSLSSYLCSLPQQHKSKLSKINA